MGIIVHKGTDKTLLNFIKRAIKNLKLNEEERNTAIFLITTILSKKTPDPTLIKITLYYLHNKKIKLNRNEEEILHKIENEIRKLQNTHIEDIQAELDQTYTIKHPTPIKEENKDIVLLTIGIIAGA